ncbi:hypothetical protein BD408DRAFT_116227 [Parasitella parasitica]|nr:hypothetical protein BD408DRAFT_116227 [Parasitella parasitica]
MKQSKLLIFSKYKNPHLGRHFSSLKTFLAFIRKKRFRNPSIITITMTFIIYLNFFLRNRKMTAYPPAILQVLVFFYNNCNQTCRRNSTHYRRCVCFPSCPGNDSTTTFADQALERFMFISKADSSRNTQFVKKFISVVSHLQTQSCRSSIFAGLFLWIE